MTKTIRVAAAIIIQPNGDYLLTSRPADKGWAGWWEFPGGKIEADETPEQALSRELQEELNITPTAIKPWLKRRYDYPATKDDVAKTVLLHFYFVTQWTGKPTAMEGQQLAWQAAKHLNVEPVLPANAPIMHALSLPEVYAISNVAELGEAQFLNALDKRLDQGLSLLQLREPHLDAHALLKLAEKVLPRCANYDCKVLLNGSVAQAVKVGADGVHLNRHRLNETTEKPALSLVAASCHNAEELAKATALAVDFCVYSPVLNTASHPEAAGMGWGTFESAIAETTLPIYALGGMQMSHMDTALAAGARGIAMQRAYWLAD